MKIHPGIRAALILAAAAASVLHTKASADLLHPGSDSGHRRLSLFQHDTSQQQVNVGDPNTGIGSLYIFGGDVLDRPHGVHVGRSAGNCATTSETELLCTAAIALGDGQITFQGMANALTFYTGLPTQFAIAGGTGAYSESRGTVTIQILTLASTDALVTVDLR